MPLSRSCPFHSLVSLLTTRMLFETLNPDHPAARPMKKKARVLRDGQLSLIVFGFDEKLLW